MQSVESVSNSSLYGSAKCSFFCFYTLDFCTQFSLYFYLSNKIENRTERVLLASPLASLSKDKDCIEIFFTLLNL